MDGQPQRWLKTHRKRVRASFYPNITVGVNQKVLKAHLLKPKERSGLIGFSLSVCPNRDLDPRTVVLPFGFPAQNGRPQKTRPKYC